MASQIARQSKGNLSQHSDDVVGMSRGDVAGGSLQLQPGEICQWGRNGREMAGTFCGVDFPSGKNTTPGLLAFNVKSWPRNS